MKSSVFSKLVHKTHVISVKIPTHYFIELNNLMLKFIWKNRFAGIGRKTWEKNNCVWGEKLDLPDIQTYYKTYISKTVFYWCISREMDKWNTIEIPELAPNT